MIEIAIISEIIGKISEQIAGEIIYDATKKIIGGNPYKEAFNKSIDEVIGKYKGKIGYKDYVALLNNLKKDYTKVLGKEPEVRINKERFYKRFSEGKVAKEVSDDLYDNIVDKFNKVIKDAAKKRPKVFYAYVVEHLKKQERIKEDEILSILSDLSEFTEQELRDILDVLKEMRELNRETKHLVEKISDILNKGVYALNYRKLTDICKKQVEREVDPLKKDKYIQELYVNRRAIEEEFEVFVSEFPSKEKKDYKNCFLMLGEAGIGKTNLLCYLAEKYGEYMPVLFYRGTIRVDRTYDLEKYVSEDITFELGCGENPQVVMKKICEILENSHKSLLIFIDGINENTNMDAIKDVIGYTLQRHKTGYIKFCLSCRDMDWRFFSDELKIVENIYFIKDHLFDLNISYKQYLKNGEYLFSWDDVPGNDSKRLLKFLNNILKIEWLKNPEINKSDNGTIINVTEGKNSLKLRLNKEENKVNLETSDGETYEYILKKEGVELNIYDSKVDNKLKNIFKENKIRFAFEPEISKIDDEEWKITSGLVTYKLKDTEKQLKIYKEYKESRKGRYLIELTDDQFEDAWLRYKKWYNVKGDLSDSVGKICKQPIMLRFLCEAFRGKYPPHDIQRKQIFDEYWKVKLKGTKEEKKAKNFLFKIIDEMIKRQIMELLEIDVENITGETTDSPFSTFSKIMSENIILYRDRRRGKNVIGFTYEAFFEYVVAKYISIKERWMEKDEEEIISDFKNLIEMSEDFRSMRGTIYQITMEMEEEDLSMCVSMLMVLSQSKLKIAHVLFNETISKLKLSTIKLFICSVPITNRELKSFLEIFRVRNIDIVEKYYGEHADPWYDIAEIYDICHEITMNLDETKMDYDTCKFLLELHILWKECHHEFDSGVVYALKKTENVMLLKMLAKSSSNYWFREIALDRLKDIYMRHLFSWDDVLGNDSKRLLKFLKNNLKLEWVENATINKSVDNATITVTDGNNTLMFALNESGNEVTLKTDCGETHEYILKYKTLKYVIGGSHVYEVINELTEIDDEDFNWELGFLNWKLNFRNKLNTKRYTAFEIRDDNKYFYY